MLLRFCPKLRSYNEAVLAINFMKKLEQEKISDSSTSEIAGENQTAEENKEGENKTFVAGWIVAALTIVFLFSAFFDIDVKPRASPKIRKEQAAAVPNTSYEKPLRANKTELEEKVLPAEGLVLPVRWGDLGVKMTSVGVIDRKQLETLYSSRGGLGDEEKKLLDGANNGNIKITEENSGFVLNLFWALGLGTKNSILENGPMQSYGNADNFASTGGWTLADGSAMNHYSRHPLIVLTKEQQKMVERVSQNIYRPCCGNSTYFPDCNHGMAMLGLLELAASQGLGEKELYQMALKVNAFWFPDQYLTIAKYLESKGIAWKDAVPKEILSAKYSSASGFSNIASEIEPVENGGGSGCGVESGAPSAPSRNSGGCGV